MEVVLQLLNGLLPLAYLLVVLDYAVLFISRAPWSVRSATGAARALVALHAGYLFLSTVVFHHIPIADVWEAFSFLAFALTLVYLVLEWQLGDRATGVFLLIPPLFFQTVSSAFVTHRQDVDPILQSSWFGVHVTAALVGYAAFALAAVSGSLYLLLYRELKRQRVGLIFRRLPNLVILARLNLSALLFGWFALTVAIIVGTWWALGLESRGRLGGVFLSDPKFLSTTAVWVLYSACLAGRYVLRWPSRSLAYVSLIAFLLMLASSFAVTLFLESFHSFV